MLSDAEESRVPSPSAGSDGQARVDAIVAAARSRPGQSDAATPPAPPPPPLAATADAVEIRLAEEIEYARRVLDTMGDVLSADVTVLQAHARTLQGFDLVGQLLGHVAKVMRTADKQGAVDLIGMHDLKIRLQRHTS